MREFERDSDKALNKTGALSRAFGGMGTASMAGGRMLTGAFMGVMGPMGVVAAGAVDLGKKLIGMAASGGSLKGIQMTFDNLTASYGINADILDRLRSSTKGAVTDFELMKQTNKALVGAGDEFGKMFGEKLPLLMAVSREAAKAQGQSVEFMFDSIVTGIKRSSPMILDNLGFQFSLTEANEKYAASIGKTVKELSKEEKQIALLNAVADASAKLIEDTGGSMDTSAKRALSWGTELKNLRDRMAVELEPVLMSVMSLIGKPGAGAAGLTGAILGVTKAIVGKIVPAIELFGSKIESFKAGPLALLQKGMGAIGKTGFEDIWQGFASIFTGAKLPSFRFLGIQLKTALRPVVGNAMAESISSGVVKGLDTIGKAFFSLKDVIGTVVSSVKSVFSVVTSLADYFIFTAQSTDWLNDSLMGIPKSLWPIAQAAGKVIGSISEVMQGIDFGAVFGGVSSAVSGVAGAAGGIDFGGMISGAVKSLEPLAGLVGNMFQEISAVASKVDFAGVFDAVMPAIKRVIAVFLKFNSMFSLSGLLFEGMKKAGPDAFDTIWNSFKPLMDNMMILIGNLASTVYNVFIAVWPTVESIVNTVFEAITEVIGIFIAEIIPLLLDAMNVVLTWVNASWPMIEEIIVGVFTVIATVIQSIIDAVVPYFLEKFQSMVDWTTENWPLIESTITIVLDAILALVQGVLDYLGDIWEKHGKSLSKIVDTVWKNVTIIIDTAIEVIQNVLKAIMLAIHGDWNGAWLAIQDALSAIWEGIKALISNALTFLKELLSLAWVAIESVARIAWSGIKLVLEAAWNAISSAGEAVWNTFASTMETIWTTMQETADRIWLAIEASLQKIWDSITGAASNIWSGINESLKAGITTASTIIGNAGQLITNAWGGIWNGMTSVVKTVWNGVISLLVKGVNSAIDIFNDMIDAANKIPGVNIGHISRIDPTAYFLAKGGILNRPTFVAGESGAEVVAPLRDLLGMMSTTIQDSLRNMRDDVGLYGVGTTQIVNNNTYEGNEYNLETNSVTRAGGLASEFMQMQMSGP